MGKIMKNSISYSGGNSMSSEDIDRLIDVSINNILSDMICIVELDAQQVSLPANTAQEFVIWYNDKIPDGYTPVGLYSMDMSDNGNYVFYIKRLVTNYSNTGVIVSIRYPTSNVDITTTIKISVVCIKSEFVELIDFT